METNWHPPAAVWLKINSDVTFDDGGKNMSSYVIRGSDGKLLEVQTTENVAEDVFSG